MLSDERNHLFFSPASLWEIAIKRGLGRDDFQVDPSALRRNLIDNDYDELAMRGEHAVAVDGLPAIHKDPFDRLLVAQAMVEGIAAADNGCHRGIVSRSDAVAARAAGKARLTNGVGHYTWPIWHNRRKDSYSHRHTGPSRRSHRSDATLGLRSSPRS